MDLWHAAGGVRQFGHQDVGRRKGEAKCAHHRGRGAGWRARRSAPLHTYAARRMANIFSEILQIELTANDASHSHYSLSPSSNGSPVKTFLGVYFAALKKCALSLMFSGIAPSPMASLNAYKAFSFATK